MAVIDRQVMLAHVLDYLPQENILSDDIILTVIENVILRVGDDDEFYSEILCKVLQAVAHLNKSKAGMSQGSVKREKSHGREIEWFESSGFHSWDSFLDSLPDVCLYLPGGGYDMRSTKSYGFYANVADPVRAPKKSRAYGTTPKGPSRWHKGTGFYED